MNYLFLGKISNFFLRRRSWATLFKSRTRLGGARYRPIPEIVADTIHRSIFELCQKKVEGSPKNLCDLEVPWQTLGSSCTPSGLEARLTRFVKTCPPSVFYTEDNLNAAVQLAKYSVCDTSRCTTDYTSSSSTSSQKRLRTPSELLPPCVADRHTRKKRNV